MIYLGNFEEVSPGAHRVGLIHYRPFDVLDGMGMTEQELLESGILVEELPEPELLEGKSAMLYCNPTDSSVWYEYADVPLTADELQLKEIQALRAENQSLNTAIVELYEIVLGGI